MYVFLSLARGKKRLRFCCTFWAVPALLLLLR